MKRSVVISFNWNTGETLNQQFEGDGCGVKAVAWKEPESFLWKDFPAKKGWTHFCHLNEEAKEEVEEFAEHKIGN